VVGDVESEGVDKSCISLNCASDVNATALPLGTYPCSAPNCPPNGHDEAGLIAKVAAANKHTIVVLETGAPVRTWWRSKVPALVEAWYPGERGGTALAKVLFGRADPSGRLPVTFPRTKLQLPTAGSAAQYPGLGVEEYYREGLDVGYRWYDATHESPAYPFGYGLTYTHFRYSQLQIRAGGPGAGTVATASVEITNTGHRAGTAVPQLYVSLPGSTAVPEPLRELKGYRSVSIQPGHRTRVTFSLNARSLAYYATSSNTWRVRRGCFGVSVGSSSRHRTLHGHLAHGAGACGGRGVRIRFGKHAANHAAVVPPPPVVTRPR
jgi:beta-glucosidase